MSRFHPREHAREDLRERLEAFCNLFSPLFSRLRSRVSRRTMEACVNDKGGWRNDTVPRSYVPVELFSPVESGVTVATSPPRLHFIPLLPFSLCYAPTRG